MAIANIISGNLTASILNHFPQFLVAPNICFNASYPQSSNYERHWSRFDQVNFVYFSVDSDTFLLLFYTNTKKTDKTFLKKFESSVYTYATIKTFRNKLKFKDKPWKFLVYKSLYVLQTNSCQNLLNWKTLVKKRSSHKIQGKQKSFINTITKK